MPAGLIGEPVSYCFFESLSIVSCEKFPHAIIFLGSFPVRTSNGDLMHFCFELQKKMNIKYHSPPMPIDLRMQGLGGNPAGGPPQASTAGSAINAPYLTDVAALQAQFAPKAEAKKD